MRRKLPPLNALKAFEAAARAGSFAKAAQELLVTQTAVSHQVKILEQYFDCALFQRLPNGLALTAEAKAILPTIGEGFDKLEEAARLLPKGRKPVADVLTISALPSFTQEWLLPRLVEFRAAWPDIDVLVQTEYRMVDLAAEDTDIAIRFGRGEFGEDLLVDLLAKETVTPVCAPALMSPAPSRARAREDLIRHTLLNSSVRMVHEPWMAWDPWLAEAGFRAARKEVGPKFSDPLLILRAACAGSGIALGRSMLIRDHLMAGRLIRPYADWSKPILSSYFVVTTKEKAKREKVAIFRDWILARALVDSAAERGAGSA
ncbi:MAG: transcriptional regulator GcvA [Tagaea sp.]|nr:transcriptional regulator GcvA [Tagaea sp.]